MIRRFANSVACSWLMLAAALALIGGGLFWLLRTMETTWIAMALVWGVLALHEATRRLDRHWRRQRIATDRAILRALRGATGPMSCRDIIEAIRAAEGRDLFVEVTMRLPDLEEFGIVTGQVAMHDVPGPRGTTRREPRHVYELASQAMIR